MKSITVVGNNTVSFISALILRQRFREYKISLIVSEKDHSQTAPILSPFKEFIGLCGIGFVPIMTAGRCTFRWGTQFDSYLDFRVEGPYKHIFAQYPFMYGKVISEKLPFKKTMHPDLYESCVNKGIHPDQFHFDLKEVTKYFRNLCDEKNIKVITDTITKVEVKSNKIVSIVGKKKYTSDFYIDATGVKRTLIKHLNPSYISFKDYLPMNEMITFSAPESKVYNSFTTVKAFKKGWLQSFPLWKSTEYRYLYNNKNMDSAKAQRELFKTIKQKLKFNSVIPIESGQLDRAWIGNCCAIGNSAGSVEPLEETELGFAINQTFILMHYLSNCSEGDITNYNKKITRVLNNIKNFIHLHYLGSKNFKLKTPDDLSAQLKVWKNRLPIGEDFAERYLLFDAPHFIRVLYGLKFFDLSKIKKEYEDVNFLVREVGKLEWNKYVETFKYRGLSHKKYLLYHYFYKDEENKT